jgi:hypothetical protein
MESVYEANELLIGLVCFGLMLIASEAGFQFGPTSGNHAGKKHEITPLGRGGGRSRVLGLLSRLHHVDGADALLKDESPLSWKCFRLEPR